MTFAIRNLSVSAYNNGFTMWHYKAGKDTLASTLEQNFFLPATDMLAAGDVVIIGAADVVGIRAVAVADTDNVVMAELR